MAKIRLKRSAVPGKVPLTTDLDLGELAINTNDGKLYIKKNDGADSIVDVTYTDARSRSAISVSSTDSAVAYNSSTGVVSVNASTSGTAGTLVVRKTGGAIEAGAGTVGAPSVTFTGATTSGLSATATALSVSNGGQETLRVTRGDTNTNPERFVLEGGSDTSTTKLRVERDAAGDINLKIQTQENGYLGLGHKTASGDWNVLELRRSAGTVNSWFEMQPYNGYTELRAKSNAASNINYLVTQGTSTSTGHYLQTWASPNNYYNLFSASPKSAITGAQNYIGASSNNAGSNPDLSALGTDTNINLDLYGKGTGAVRARSDFAASANASITGNTTVGGTLGVTGATTLSTLTTSGLATLNSLNVTGTANFNTLTSSSSAAFNSLAVTNNATVGGTLGVTGALTGSTATMTYGSGVGLTLNRTGNSVNAVIEYTNTSGSLYAGHGAANTFAIGPTANLASTAAPAWVTATATGVGILKGTAADAGTSLQVHKDVSGGVGNVALFSNNSPGVLNSEARIYLSANGATTRSVYLGGINTNGSSNMHAMTFGVSASSAEPAEKMRLDSLGLLYVGDSTGSDYTRISPFGGFIRYTAGSNAVQIDGIPANGTSTVTFQFGRVTTTSGVVQTQFLRGDGTATVDHQLISGSTGALANLCRNGGYVNIGQAGPFAGALSLRESGAYGGPGANSSADGVVLENNGNTGMTILTPNTSSGQLYFGDNDANAQGGLSYAHTTDELFIRAANATRATVSALGLDVAGSTDTSGVYKVDGVQVVTNRRTGWTTPTGTATRTAYATSTATVVQVAERLKALIDDLIAHGLIGA